MRHIVSFKLNSIGLSLISVKTNFCLYILKLAGRNHDKVSFYMLCYACSVYLYDQKCWGQLDLWDST